MKDNKCNAYIHTYKCNEQNCEGCSYRIQEKPIVSIAELIKIMYAPTKYTFYLNDKIVDLDMLYDNDAPLNGLQFESNNVVRLYN